MKLRHIELHTCKLEEASAFYRVLGFREVLDQRPHHILLAGTDDDSGTISLLRYAVAPEVAGGAVIYFECDNVDDQYLRASEAGLNIAFRPISKSSGRREAGVLDPDGRLICIYHTEER